MSIAKKVITLLSLEILLFGCSPDAHKIGQGQESYYKALEETDPQNQDFLQPGSTEEKSAIDAFKSFYAVFSEDAVKRETRNLYAADAYFRDGIREVKGAENIETYFIKTTEAIHECRFQIDDVAIHNGNYYFRWIMKLKLKRQKDETIEAVGMSHVRFNKRGKIIFHQDYWDSVILYEKIPIMGSIIRWVKNKF